jgi:hypothetical protein
VAYFVVTKFPNVAIMAWYLIIKKPSFDTFSIIKLLLELATNECQRNNFPERKSNRNPLNLLKK